MKLLQKDRNNDHKKNGKEVHIEDVVLKRYAAGAEAKEGALCCPVSYDPQYLEVIPEEILEKDYGCGDPSRYVNKGDVVLDLGSGGGKICYIASQIVGPEGRVIGVDFNPTMLELARKYQDDVARRIGWSNIDFRWGKIQDLKTNLEVLESTLSAKAVVSVDDYMYLQEQIRDIQFEKPLVADESIDVIVSNCVLNLVRSQEKKQLFREMYRVLKKGGRVAISDIVSDEVIPEELQNDPDLWSGCISGAFQEMDFVMAFEDAGFYGLKIDKFDSVPWRTVKGIEFRSVTITALKGKEGACFERNQAVIYKGPWKQVEDDDQHVLRRGERIAVCDNTFQILTQEPYKNEIIPVPPIQNISQKEAQAFDCSRVAQRHPRETKGMEYDQTSKTASSCLDGGCC